MKHSLTYLVTYCTAYDCALFFAIRWDIDEKKVADKFGWKEETIYLCTRFRERTADD